MKKNISNIVNKSGRGPLRMVYGALCIAAALVLGACQDRDLPGSGQMQLTAPDVAGITGTLSGENN